MKEYFNNIPKKEIKFKIFFFKRNKVYSLLKRK